MNREQIARPVVSLMAVIALCACAVGAQAQETPVGAPGADAAPEVVVDPVAAPEVDARVRAQALGLLRGYEYRPTREDFEALGEEATVVAALLDIHGDPGLGARMRVNALVSASLFPGPVSQAALEGVITDPATTNMARRSAIVAYGAAFGAAAAPLITAQLTSDDPHTQRIAAETLARIEAGGERR